MLQEKLLIMYRKFLEYKGHHRTNLQANVKEKKPHLSRKNIINFLAFARKYEQWTIDDWNHVIFLDDTKFNKFSLDGRIWCWTHDPIALSK